MPPKSHWQKFNKALSQKFGTRKTGGGFNVATRQLLYRQAKEIAERNGDINATPRKLITYINQSLFGDVPEVVSQAEHVSDSESAHENSPLEPLFGDRFGDFSVAPDTPDTPFVSAQTPFDGIPLTPHSGGSSLDYKQRLLGELSQAEHADVRDFQQKYGDELNDFLPNSQMDRATTLRSLLAKNTKQDLTDDLGNPLSMQKMVQIAQVSPIWPMLSAEQKRLFLQDEGTLASGKRYISRRIGTSVAPRRKTLVQLSDGRRIDV